MDYSPSFQEPWEHLSHWCSRDSSPCRRGFCIYTFRNPCKTFGNIQSFGEKSFFVSHGVWDGIEIASNKNWEQGNISFFGVCVCARTVAFVWGVYVMHVLGVHVCVSDACTCAYRLKPEEALGALLCPPLPCSLVAGSSLVLLFPWLASAPPTPHPQLFLSGFPPVWILNSSLHVSSANIILFLSCLSHPSHHSILVQVIEESLSTSLVKINISNFVTSLWHWIVKCKNQYYVN